jgi:hypothetical protein
MIEDGGIGADEGREESGKDKNGQDNAAPPTRLTAESRDDAGETMGWLY